MRYAVFDLSLGRMHDVCATATEAVALVRTMLDANDDDYADDLAIVSMAETGEFGFPVTGDALRTVVARRG